MSENANVVVRSRTKSFRDLYVAVVTANTPSLYETGTPVKLARAIKGKVSDKFSTEKIYSDDGVEETITNYEGTEVEFEVNSLAPQDRALLFGQLYAQIPFHIRNGVRHIFSIHRIEQPR